MVFRMFDVVFMSFFNNSPSDTVMGLRDSSHELLVNFSAFTRADILKVLISFGGLLIIAFF